MTSNLTSVAPVLIRAAPNEADVQIEREVLGAILVDPSCLLVAARQQLDWRDFQDRTHRRIAEAIWRWADPSRTRDGGAETLTPALVASMAREVRVADVQRLEDLGNPRVVAGVEERIAHIVVGAKARLCRIATEAYQSDIAEAPHQVDALTDRFVRRLQTIQARGSISRRDNRAAAIGERIREREASGIGQLIIPTGLAWMDALLDGGLTLAKIVLTTGRYKGRKTTLWKHILLNMLLSRSDAFPGGVPCSFSIMDGTQEDLYWGFVSLLATAYIRREDTQRLERTRGLSRDEALRQVPTDEWRIRANGLPAAMRSPRQAEAIAWAERKLDTFPLVVNDATDMIADVGRLVRTMELDRIEHGCQVFVVDFVQKLTAGQDGNRTADLDAVVDALQRFAVESQVILIMLSQRNEAQNSGQGSRTTVGTRGSGAIPAAADYIFETVYDQEAAPDILRVNCWGGRYVGADEHAYRIEPYSGLILDPLSIPAPGR